MKENIQSDRKLSAIAFTDIAGFAELASKNENNEPSIDKSQISLKSVTEGDLSVAEELFNIGDWWEAQY